MKQSKPSRKKHKTFYVADFETTVYEGQTNTEVWGGGFVKSYTEDVKIFNSIDSLFDIIFNTTPTKNIKIYFHNLKFDGSFILNYLLKNPKFKHGYKDGFKTPSELKPYEFIYLISNLGQWYNIIIRDNLRTITILDSLKILPMGLRKACKDFKTKHQKLEIEYKGLRKPGQEIPPNDKEYIKNDVLGLKECLEYLYDFTCVKATIGASCLAEYKKDYPSELWEMFFPNLTKSASPAPLDFDNLDTYIRKAYKGGWVYVAKGCANKIITDGLTADVNSLYPSVMHSSSGNVYPVGIPVAKGKGKPPTEYINTNKYYTFLRIRCRFDVKYNMLPFVTLPTNWLYPPHTVLESSDIIDKQGNRRRYYIDVDNTLKKAKPELTLTITDYKLFLENYNIYDIEYLDYVTFEAQKGLFDKYIDKWAKVKKESEGAMRQIAKLYLNNLYGKFATSIDSSYKVAYLDNNVLKFKTIYEYNKTPVYIPIGAAITSYARVFTIRAAQANYYGANKRGFKYADTDSIHCDLSIDEIKYINIDDSNFLCWKIENRWDKAIFVRAKTYIEHIIPTNTYNIKCAGMNEECKNKFIAGLESGKYKLSDFKRGLTLDGKLLPKQIAGGIVLYDTTFKMH